LADISQARGDLGYEPRVDFEEGMRRTCEYFARTMAAGSRMAR
jgi:nucleoside-diphosphate-sugar epimerase